MGYIQFCNYSIIWTSVNKNTNGMYQNDLKGLKIVFT